MCSTAGMSDSTASAHCFCGLRCHVAGRRPCAASGHNQTALLRVTLHSAKGSERRWDKVYKPCMESRPHQIPQSLLNERLFIRNDPVDSLPSAGKSNLE